MVPVIRVRIPAFMAPALHRPLQERGLAIVADGAAAIVLSRDHPEPGVRWLALADDDRATIAALDAGADDAVAATASPAVIAARIARLARSQLLWVGPLAIDPVARQAWRDGGLLALLPREYAVLLCLAQQADRLVTRAALRSHVWGRDFDPGTNVIEVHVSRLRGQLDRAAPPMLLTERGRGYRLVSTPAIAERRRAS